MEEYNKELVSVLQYFEQEDITNLSDILKDTNEFNKFDNITLAELIKAVDYVIEENKNSKLSKIKKELNEKYLNQYIKYSDDGISTIYKKVVNIIVDPAFGGNDFAIKFISIHTLYVNNDGSMELKLCPTNIDESYKPIVLYSFLETVNIISKEDFDKLLETYNIKYNG